MLRSGMVNYSKGVISPRLWGRVDVAAYNAGVKRGENVIIYKQGALGIRPGFRVVNEVLDGGEERFVSFQFSDEQPYALALGQEYMQPMTGGGVVLEEELVIEGATNANPMVLTAQNHGFAAGEEVFVLGVEGDLGGFLNERIWTVVASLTDDTFSIDLDGTALPAFTSATGGTVRVDPPDPVTPPPATPPVLVAPAPPPVYSGGGGGRFEPTHLADIP